MREIKFRAYHFGAGYSVRPEMLYDNKLGDVLRWKQEGQDLSDVMQYTGLKDKNGVEIYEGDIVHKTYRSNLTATGEVIYDSATYFVREVEGYAFLHGGHEGEEIEVIGNRYENPELLEESK